MSRENAIGVGDYQVDLVSLRAETYRVLADVYQLLEEYAPVWYSSKIRIRLQTELGATEGPDCDS